MLCNCLQGWTGGSVVGCWPNIDSVHLSGVNLALPCRLVFGEDLVVLRNFALAYLVLQLLGKLVSHVNQDRQALIPLTRFKPSVDPKLHTFTACTYTCSTISLQFHLAA